MKFKKYLEARENVLGSQKDIDQLKNLGLKNMQIYTITKPPLTTNELRGALIEANEKHKPLFVVFNAIKGIPNFERLSKYSGQVFVVDHVYDDQNIVIAPLGGVNDEGIAFRVPIGTLSLANKKEIAHGNWLSTTFFSRENYVKPSDRHQYLTVSDRDMPILYKLLVKLKQCKSRDCVGVVDALSKNILDIYSWTAAQDLLTDMDVDVTELQKILNNQ